MIKFHGALLLAVLLIPAGCSAQTAAESADARVIENLREAGADLTKPHLIEFFFYFPTEGKARTAAKELAELKYSVKEIRPSNDPTSWTVLANRKMVPRLVDISSSTRELELIADEYDGEYDGWGTEVVK